MTRKLPDVAPDDFSVLDIRVGRVLTVEGFPEARTPAWKLTVDFGLDVGVLRTSARITNYRPGELLGRLVVGAINLGEKPIAGFTSEFLVLGAVRSDRSVRLLGVDAGAEPGDRIA